MPSYFTTAMGRKSRWFAMDHWNDLDPEPFFLATNNRIFHSIGLDPLGRFLNHYEIHYRVGFDPDDLRGAELTQAHENDPRLIDLFFVR